MSNSFIFTYRKLTAIFLIIFCSSNFSAFAQTRRSAGQSAPKCSGAWTGVIKYTRTQSQSDNKTIDRVSGRGKDTRNWEMKYEYKANISVVESPATVGSSTGKASINHAFSSIEKNSAVERNSCDQGKTWRDMSGTFSTETKTSGTGNEEANVTVGVNSDGTYSVSVGIPQIKGQTTGSQTSTFSGQCTKKEGKNLTMPPATASIEGNSLTSDGTHRLNPDDPNRISGSYTRSNYGVTETITWSLQKCGAKLRITDLKFEHMKFPNWNEWKEIEDLRGTIDGNLVKIKATVLNASGETKYADLKFKETFKGDKWDGSRPDGLLSNGEASVRLEPGEEREVEIVWDSSGYAWFNDGRPRLLQRIKAELEENGKRSDEMTKNLTIAPKPLILMHGIWSDYRIWEPLYQNLLTTSHSYHWKAYAVGKNAHYGAMSMGGKFLSDWYSDSVYDNADQVARYVKYAQEDSNAWHVDMVGHSTGGLVGRLYLHKLMKPVSDGRPQVKHLLMLGTPNGGAKCVEVFLGKFNLFKKELKAARELTDDEMGRFNQFVKNTGGTKLAALVGNPVPIICGGYEWNDGFVTVNSAKHGVADFSYANDLNGNLVDTRNFSNFVLPHLVTGPDGKYPKPVRSDPNDIDRWKVEQGNPHSPRYDPRMRISFSKNAGNISREDSQTFLKEVNVLPKQTVEIEVPVETAENFGINFMVDKGVSVSLLDQNGKIIGKNMSNSPFASAMVRTLFFEKAITRGMWKLKIENGSDFEQTFLGYAWSTKFPVNSAMPVAE